MCIWRRGRGASSTGVLGLWETSVCSHIDMGVLGQLLLNILRFPKFKPLRWRGRLLTVTVPLTVAFVPQCEGKVDLTPPRLPPWASQQEVTQGRAVMDGALSMHWVHVQVG